MPTAVRLASILLATGVAGCSPTLDWRDTGFAEADGARALFPCRPDRVARRVRLAGETASFALASCSAGGLVFALGHVELTDAARAAAASTELQATVATNLGGSARQLPAGRVAGAAAEPAPRRIAVQGRRPDGSALEEQALFVVRGRRLLQASIVGARIEPEVADTFFSGLKLGP